MSSTESVEAVPDDEDPSTSEYESTSSGAQQTNVPLAPKVSSGTFSRTPSSSRGHSGQRSVGATRAYRELLNATICEAVDPSLATAGEAFADSQIGASYWTAGEKSSFFARLPLVGPGDLRALSQAIGTKSEPEIKAYILLLQAGVSEHETTCRARDRFSLDDIEAAVEVGQECVEAEESAAQALRQQVATHEEGLERAKHGDDWLIDESVELKSSEDLQQSDKGDGSNDEHDSKTLGSEADSTMRQPRILDAAAFLNLSRNVFMNSPDNLNWRALATILQDTQEPALFRTAFTDLENLAVSLTCRLVQATIFQVLARLRSAADARIVPVVQSGDVKSACDVLDFRVDRSTFWINTVRQQGLQVFSDSKRFNDGRPGTKNGYKLTMEELRKELGANESLGEGETNEEDDSVLDALDDDSDAFTLVSTDDETVPLDDGRSSKTAIDLDCEEDEYLEHLDQGNSLKGENELRVALGLSMLDDADLKPSMQPKRKRNDDTASHWRDVVQYEAEWEQHGVVAEDDFAEMESQGRRGRKRRQLHRSASGTRTNRKDATSEESGGSASEVSSSDGAISGSEMDSS